MSFTNTINFEDNNLLEQRILEKINFNVFTADIAALELSESLIPKQLQFDLHFDMILNEGTKAVTNYYRNLSLGKNAILEKARLSKKITQSQLNEAISKFNDSTDLNKLFLTEAEIAGFDAALIGGEYTAKTAGNTMIGLVKSLFSALTEGGSTIGKIHLVLDIVGVLGDAVMGVTGIPIGMIADVLNAVIYFARGKWLLGTISIIAAFIPFAGDTLKGLKGVAGPMEKVLVTTATKGNRAGAQILSSLPVKEQGLVIKGLRFIAKNISGAMSKAQRILSVFFSSFLTKLSGWIPFIGKPLSKFFDNIGKAFSKYADNMSNFANGFGKVEKEALELALKKSNKLVDATVSGGGKMVLDPTSQLVNCYDKSGKLLGQFSPELLTNPKILNSRYPNLFNLAKDPQGKQLIKYYNAVGSSTEKMQSKLLDEVKRRGWKSLKSITRLTAFLGKQIIKLNTGKTPEELGIPETEVQYIGSTAALHSFIHDRFKKEKEKTGAVYIPAIDLDSSEEEVFKQITDHQNYLANLFGQPEIVPVIYDKYGNADIKKEFEDYWNYIASGAKAEDDKKKESSQKVSESFKYIIPYYKFN